MNTTLLGEDIARRANLPLADLVYLQREPVLLAPQRLRWLRRRRTAAGAPRKALAAARREAIDVPTRR